MTVGAKLLTLAALSLRKERPNHPPYSLEGKVSLLMDVDLEFS